MTLQNVPNYKPIFSEEALKSLRKLDKFIVQQILKKISDLCSNAQNLNIKKLKSTKYNLYRLRVGVYRVIYTIENKALTIHIVAIGHRKDIYKKVAEVFA